MQAQLKITHNSYDDAQEHAEHCPQLLQPYDPRWVFAVRAVLALRAEPNPVMVESARERLIAHATGMGLTRFDALAIISIVAGEAAAGRDPLGSGIESRLANIGACPRATRSATPGISATSATIITAIVLGMLAYFTLTL